MSVKVTFVPLRSATLEDASASDLNAAISSTGSAADVVVLTSDGFADALAQSDVADEFERSPRLAGILVTQNPALPPDDATWELPGWMPAFLPPVSPARCAAVRLQSLSEANVGKFQNVAGALREWFVRAVRMGENASARAVDSDQPATGDDRLQLPALRPRGPRPDSGWIREHVDQLDLSVCLPRVASEADAVALKAGLLQVHDFLDASHDASQSVQGDGENSAGDYWHAVMHRREPDYSNAKYWFRQVGSHPVFTELGRATGRLLDDNPQVRAEWGGRLIDGDDWNPAGFVDLCQSCPQSESDELSLFARQIQWLEMLLLLRQTHADAAGE